MNSGSQHTIRQKDALVEDEEQLSSLGYKQELYRTMSTIMSFAFAFTAVAVVTSITSLYPTAIATGGPAVVIWSWLGGSVLTILTGLSMAEIGSRYPSAGSVYYWACRMGGPFMGFCVGWFNFLGNTAADCFFALTFAEFISYVLVLQGMDPLSIEVIVGISIGVSFVWALLNMLRVDQMGALNYIGAVWQVGSTLAVLIMLAVGCSGSSNLATSEQVFFSTFNATGFENIGYVSLIGLLSALYCFTGYEASGHLGEETVGASKSVPKGILATVIGSAVVGTIFLLSLLYATAGDIESFVNSDLGTFSIFQKCLDQKGALGLGVIVIINAFFSGFSSLTVTVRTTFALSRDNGFPFAFWVKQVNASTMAPNFAVLACFVSSSLILLLPLGSTTAFTAVTSISTIGFQISYAIPIFLRTTVFRNQFEPGPFNLGKFGVICGAISSGFLFLTSILFFFPVENPITVENFNWTVVVFMGTFLIAGAQWILFAKKHYHSPEWSK
ncbi:amino acid/polyamine transporter I [Gorgonomyces haynaldii]|nr:amino acid/polyamine transporter I [Gorgonomyces haynaldii]